MPGVSLLLPSATAIAFVPRPNSLPTRRSRDARSSSSRSPRAKLSGRPIARPLLHHVLGTAAAASLALAAASASSVRIAPPAYAASVLETNTLQRRYIVTDAAALLRYSLPLDEATDPPARNAQVLLEKLGIDLRARGGAGQNGVRRDLAALDRLLQSQRVDMLLQVPAKRRVEASNIIAVVGHAIAALEGELGIGYSADNTPNNVYTIFPKQLASVGVALLDIVASPGVTAAPKFDTVLAESLRAKALSGIAQLEELMVTDSGLPFRIPRRYDALPRLQGRATVELKIQRKSVTAIPSDGQHAERLVATLDGYSAPLNAGNFVDLCERRVYDGAVVQSSERGYFLQFANEGGTFTDPETGSQRRVPMEVLVAGEQSPVYGSTLDDVGLGDLQPVLPATAYASLASFHSVEDVNDASSSCYVFLFDPKSNQARSMGGNALNGSVSVFGYVTEGLDILPILQAGDKIVSARVLSGLEHFRAHAG
jgi:peptidylprolyl isomerase